jgi:hypothetical protein
MVTMDTEQTSSAEHTSPPERCAHPVCVEARHLHAYKLDRREDEQDEDQLDHDQQGPMINTELITRP